MTTQVLGGLGSALRQPWTATHADLLADDWIAL